MTITNGSEEVLAASAAVTAATERLDDLRKQRADLDGADGSTPLSAQLRARARRADIDEQVLLAAADLDDAERDLAIARHAARAATLATIDARRRPLVARLEDALLAASEINAALAELDEEAAACGGTCAAFAAVRAETPVEPSAFDAWRRHVEAHQLRG